VTPLILTTTQAVPATTLTVGVAATAFTPVTAAGGAPTVSFALSGGSLPTGLNFSTVTGQITGTPTTALALTTFTVTATDQSAPTPQTSSKTFTLTVNKGTDVISFTGPGTTVVTASPVTVSATGQSSAAVVFTSNTLTVCTVSGTSVTLVTTGTCTIVANQAGDANWNTAAAVNQSFTVSAAPPTLTTTQAVPATTLTVGVAATAFTPVTAAGGSGTVSFALSGGTLPTGLAFSTVSGQITGTPSTALALTTFSVTATDQTAPTPQTSVKSFTLTVNKGTDVISFTGPASTSLSGSPVTISATGLSSAAVVFSSTTLPVCTVSGTAVTLLTTGTCSITANQAADANWNVAAPVSQSFTVTALTLTTTQAVPSATLTVGAAIAPMIPVTAAGGAGTVSFALSGGSLPSGLSFSTATGQISGTPTSALGGG
jgi:large repetitive protein